MKGILGRLQRPICESPDGTGCVNVDSPLIQVGFNFEVITIFHQLIDTFKLATGAFSHMRSCLTIQLLGLVYASALLKVKPQNLKGEVINNIRYKMHESLRSEPL